MRKSSSKSPRESREKSPTPQKRTSLLVRNIVYSKKDQQIKPDELRECFSKFGEVRDVYIPRDYYTQKSRGFCFVEFLKLEDAREALEKSDGTEVLGSTVKIVFAREGRKAVSPKQPNEMRRRDRYKHRRSSSPRRRHHRRRYFSFSRTPPRYRHRRSSSSSR